MNLLHVLSLMLVFSSAFCRSTYDDSELLELLGNDLLGELEWELRQEGGSDEDKSKLIMPKPTSKIDKAPEKGDGMDATKMSTKTPVVQEKVSPTTMPEAPDVPMSTVASKVAGLAPTVTGKIMPLGTIKPIVTSEEECLNDEKNKPKIKEELLGRIVTLLCDGGAEKLVDKLQESLHNLGLVKLSESKGAKILVAKLKKIKDTMCSENDYPALFWKVEELMADALGFQFKLIHGVMKAAEVVYKNHVQGSKTKHFICENGEAFSQYVLGVLENLYPDNKELKMLDMKMKSLILGAKAIICRKEPEKCVTKPMLLDMLFHVKHEEVKDAFKKFNKFLREDMLIFGDVLCVEGVHTIMRILEPYLQYVRDVHIKPREMSLGLTFVKKASCKDLKLSSPYNFGVEMFLMMHNLAHHEVYTVLVEVMHAVHERSIHRDMLKMAVCELGAENALKEVEKELKMISMILNKKQMKLINDSVMKLKPLMCNENAEWWKVEAPDSMTKTKRCLRGLNCARDQKARELNRILGMLHP